MKLQRKGIITTQDKLKEKLEVIDTEQYINPFIEIDKTNQNFTSIVTVDKKDGTIYVDNTEISPIRSIGGYISIFILYDWTKILILATPINDTKDETIIESFKTHIRYITNRGFKPCFNIIDNVASKATKIYLKEEKTPMQLVKPHNHQANAAERTIQTFENQFISGLRIGGEKFTTVLWSYLIGQAQYSINILSILRVHPKLSTYHVLEETDDFN